MNNPPPDPNAPPQRSVGRGWLVWILVLVAIGVAYTFTSGSLEKFETVDHGQFLETVSGGYLKAVTIKSDYWEGERRDPGPGEKYWPASSKISQDIKVIRCNEPYSPDSDAARNLYAAIAQYNAEADEYNKSKDVTSNKKPRREHIRRYNKTSMGKVWQFFLAVVPWIILLGAMYFFLFRHMRAPGGQSILSFGKSRARLNRKEHTQVTFDDVAGIKEAKE